MQELTRVEGVCAKHAESPLKTSDPSIHAIRSAELPRSCGEVSDADEIPEPPERDGMSMVARSQYRAHGNDFFLLLKRR
ncbi:unnamed protein product [Periconia digitata]|uniref:Uncharacterized protein n=1 Tax=Periconia digitata TaxID=1303443 RepID=A0A9W4XH04_9PLEO|nr:unnamed protein product [Periconia digitata]